MSDKLLNWTPDKGDPYQVPNRSYEYDNPTIKILGEEETEEIRKIIYDDKKISFRYSFPVTYYFYKVCTIINLTSLELLVGFYDDREIRLGYSYDFEELPEEILIDFDKPFKVFSSYPFNKMVEIKIHPFTVRFRRKIDNAEIISSDTNIGYIIWQIAMAYKHIYQNHAKEVGIYGHDFSNLAFGSLTFTNNNIIFVDIDS